MFNVRHYHKFPHFGQDLYNYHLDGLIVREYFAINNPITDHILSLMTGSSRHILNINRTETGRMFLSVQR